VVLMAGMVMLGVLGIPAQPCSAEEVSADVSFHTGWNLVGIVRDNPNVTTARAWAEEIEAQTQFYVLAMMDWEGGAWISYVRRDGNTYSYLATFEDTSFSLTAEESYMVFCVDSGIPNGYVWHCDGTPYISPLTIELDAGWNNILILNPALTAASALKASIEADLGAGAVVKISNLTVADTWESWDGIVGSDFDIHPGQGLFVLLRWGGTWTQ